MGEIIDHSSFLLYSLGNISPPSNNTLYLLYYIILFLLHPFYSYTISTFTLSRSSWISPQGAPCLSLNNG